MHKHGRKRQPLTNIDVNKLRDPGRYGDGHAPSRRPRPSPGCSQQRTTDLRPWIVDGNAPRPGVCFVDQLRVRS
jgi:hypothetical protein